VRAAAPGRGGTGADWSVAGLAAGARLALPGVPVMAVFGAAFGTAAAQNGLGLAEATLMSALVFAGASQFVVAEIWSSAASPAGMATIGLVTAAVNMRLLLMSASLRPWLGGLPARRTYPALSLLTDPGWLLISRYRSEGGADAAAFLGSGVVLWLTWIAATAPGHVLGDAIIAQGMEAGGHRGAFDAAHAEARTIGLFALLPAVADAVAVPVVATGGIADARGVAAALLLGASAVQVGTGLLRTPEAKLASAHADAIGRTLPEDTMLSRAFSGRPGRTIATAYARAATAPGAPPPAPYPVQRALTQAMRDAAIAANDIDRMQAWAGQSAAMARAERAGEVMRRLWQGAQELLR
jgi:hypothetical protein